MSGSPEGWSRAFFPFSGHTRSTWKVPGQGSNLRCSSNNTGSLTTRPPGNSSCVFLKKKTPSAKWLPTGTLLIGHF